MLGSGIGFGASLLLLAPQSTVVGACIVLVLTGITFSLYASQSNSSLQMVVPDRLRGRVLSLYGYVFFGTAPLGGLFTGWFTRPVRDRARSCSSSAASSMLAAGGGVVWVRVRQARAARPPLAPRARRRRPERGHRARVGLAGERDMSRARVVIVGAGFGGLSAARALRGADADVLVIDRHNYHLFQPLLYQVASGLLDPAEIAHPVRTILRGHPTPTCAWMRCAASTSNGNVVRCSDDIPYDYLIVAAGAVDQPFRQ